MLGHQNAARVHQRGQLDAAWVQPGVARLEGVAGELLAKLRSSLALVSPSLEEGFDYPVLEAKAEGIPTLLSQIPVHAEFHAGSSLFFPAEGGEEVFALELSRLLTDSRLWWDLSAAGRQLALSLSVTRQQRALNAQIAELS